MSRARRAARTREEILDAARALIVEQGLEKVSLRAVAKAVDYSPAALYQYFDNKDDLLAELARRAATELQAAMLSAAEGHPRPLVALAESYVHFARTHTQDFLLLFTRVTSSRRSLEQTAGGPYAVLLGAMADALPGADHRRIEERTYGLWALTHGMAMLQVKHLQGFDADFPAADHDAIIALLRGYGC